LLCLILAVAALASLTVCILPIHADVITAKEKGWNRIGIVEKTITELPKGKIAFTSDRDGNVEIYIMNLDGSGLTNLTNNPAEDCWPSFSPDGSKIAFQSDREGNYEVYIMNTNGSEQTNLTNNPANDGGLPSFSPDGSKIAFGSNRDGNGETYIMNIDGSGQANISNTQEWDLDPFFSPDGSKITFRSDRDANGGIYTFSSDEDVNWEIYIMNVDGSGQTRLTNNQIWDWESRFSPDGSKIVFNSTSLDKNADIYIMNADGSGQINLTNNPAKELDPFFSPDGTKIAFASAVSDSEIYIMNIDGSGRTRLTNNPANDRQPCFYLGGNEIKVVDRFERFRPAGPLTPEITTYIPTPLDLSSKPTVIGTNLLLAILTMIPFAAAAELFTVTLTENEEYLKRRIRKIPPVAYLRHLNKKIEKILDKKMRHYPAVRNIAQLLSVILFYGLVFSLLDHTWKPFSRSGLILFISMTIAYGLVGLADDIIQWRTLKKWKVPAEFSVHTTNLLISVISVSTSRLLTIVPGMMFGTPEALRVDESTLGIVKRNRLLKISAVTFLVIGSGLWLMTIATSLIQSLLLPGFLTNFVGGFEGFLLLVFAVALENTFVQMLGLPGGFGRALKQKNRWLWFAGLVAVAFIFYHTLINPRSELVEALQETNVVLFLSVSVVFIVIAFGLWLYFRMKRKLP